MKKNPFNILARWLPVLLYGVLIFKLSSTPAPETMPRVPYADKFLHFGAFFVLGALFLWASRSSGWPKSALSAGLLTFTGSTVFGILIEIHQIYLPHRKAEAMDVAADVVGCMVSLLLYMIVIRKKNSLTLR